MVLIGSGLSILPLAHFGIDVTVYELNFVNYLRQNQFLRIISPFCTCCMGLFTQILKFSIIFSPPMMLVLQFNFSFTLFHVMEYAKFFN